MIGKLFLVALAVLANLAVFKWHKYDETEKTLRIWHIAFAIALAIGALTNLLGIPK